jgi:DNA-3-methyladenine glycosylase
VFRFDRPVCAVAQSLLGATIRLGGVAIRLTETEAYAGQADPAAHAVRGRRPATAALFGPPGTLYCYLSYGIHICGNLVCEADGSGSAVLLRAGDVIEGVEVARRRRGFDQPGRARPDAWLAKGPGCLGQALGLTLEHSGWRAGQDYTIDPPTQDHSPNSPAASVIACGPRVGVSAANLRPWRYWLEGAASVSAYARSPRAVPGAW